MMTNKNTDAKTIKPDIVPKENKALPVASEVLSIF